MNYMLVRHKVADFTKWKLVFDSHSEAQREAGLKLKQLMQNIDNSHEVFLLFEVDDIEKAKAFVTSPDVPNAQQIFGVIDKPDIYFLI